MPKGKMAFAGSGVIGYPMAGNLVENGYEVTVFNRIWEKGLEVDHRAFEGGRAAPPHLQNSFGRRKFDI